MPSRMGAAAPLLARLEACQRRSTPNPRSTRSRPSTPRRRPAPADRPASRSSAVAASVAVPRRHRRRARRLHDDPRPPRRRPGRHRGHRRLREPAGHPAAGRVDCRRRRHAGLRAHCPDRQHRVPPGQSRPTTWGFNGSYLGPTLVAHRGERVRVDIHNELAEPTTVHWHGMHLPAEMDGGPHQMIEPGDDWSPTLDRSTSPRRRSGTTRTRTARPRSRCGTASPACSSCTTTRRTRSRCPQDVRRRRRAAHRAGRPVQQHR